MKKIFFLIIVLFLTNTKIFAEDFIQFCSESSPNRSLSGNVMSLSGFNTLTRNIVENRLESLLKKETGSNFKIKINNFYGTNPFSGEFKSLKVKSKRYESNGLFLSDVEAKTICKYNKISYSDEELSIDENILFKFSAKITQDDLNQTISSDSYLNAIEKLNNNKNVSNYLKIEKADVEIVNNKLVFKYQILPFPKYDLYFIGPIKISFKADLMVENGKVKISNFDINSKKSLYKNILPIINQLNPTNWKFNIDKKNKGKLHFQNVKIENNEILLDGVLIIYKTDKSI